jgi:hypothetical protein
MQRKLYNKEGAGVFNYSDYAWQTASVTWADIQDMARTTTRNIFKAPNIFTEVTVNDLTFEYTINSITADTFAFIGNLKSDAQEQLDWLYDHIIDFTSAITLLNTEMAAAQEDITALETVTAAHTSAIGTLQTTTAGHTTTLSTHGTQITALQAVDATHNTQITALQAVDTTHTTNISALQTTSATHTSQITALQAVDTTHTTNISTLQTTSATHTSQITALQAVDTTHNTQITALQTTDASHTSQISALQAVDTTHNTQIAALQTTDATHTSQISSLNTLTSSHTTTLASHTSTLASHESTLATHTTEIADNTSDISSILQRITDLAYDSVNETTNLLNYFFANSLATDGSLAVGENAAIANILNVGGRINAVAARIRDLRTTNLTVASINGDKLWQVAAYIDMRWAPEDPPRPTPVMRTCDVSEFGNIGWYEGRICIMPRYAVTFINIHNTVEWTLENDTPNILYAPLDNIQDVIQTIQIFRDGILV